MKREYLIDKVMYTSEEVAAKISQGERLLLAGAEEILEKLPRGQWIGGSIPYFMAEHGGEFNTEKVFVNELPLEVVEVQIKKYDATTISQIYHDAPWNGFSIMITPSGSKTHREFGLNAPDYEDFALKPLAGWVSGVALADLGKVAPKVFNGETGEIITDGAVAMHLTLSEGKYAEIKIINIFQQGTGDSIEFLEDGSEAEDVLINGVRTNFLNYLVEKNFDNRLPLVADYFGAMINVSFQKLDESMKKVILYAPVYKGIEYKLAAPVEDYVNSFNQQMPYDESDKILFSCNCILNYLYSGLEGKQTGGVVGPITFGEIAYQLLNQTLVYVTIQ